MKYYVELGGDEVTVEANRGVRGDWQVLVSGRDCACQVADLSGRPVVMVDGAVFEVDLEGRGPALGYVASGLRGYCRVESERVRLATRSQKARLSGAELGELVSPMPGRVVKVIASPGDSVESGQALVVMEAMKMENELVAPRAGVVAKVLVQVGDRVEGGTLLVQLV